MVLSINKRLLVLYWLASTRDLSCNHYCYCVHRCLGGALVYNTADWGWGLSFRQVSILQYSTILYCTELILNSIAHTVCARHTRHQLLSVLTCLAHSAVLAFTFWQCVGSTVTGPNVYELYALRRI
jgi:hypothetical protein